MTNETSPARPAASGNGSARGAYVPGLEGVVAAQTRLSHVDGQAGELLIAGFPVEALAGRAAFEEMVCLLWHDVLPTEAQLDALRAELASPIQWSS